MSEILGGTTASWSEELIDYYTQGYSDAEVAAALKITIKDFNRQVSENATFAKLVDYGHTLSTAFWEGLARKNIDNKNLNGPLYAFYMKNKFGWADKTENVNTSYETAQSEDALRQEVLRKAKELASSNNPELIAAVEVLRPVAVVNG